MSRSSVVPWWEAVGRVVPDVGTIREVGMSGDQAWVRCGDYDPDGVAPDGTVEVLGEGPCFLSGLMPEWHDK